MRRSLPNPITNRGGGTDSAIPTRTRLKSARYRPGFSECLNSTGFCRRERICLQSDQLGGREVLGVGQDDRLLQGELGGVEVFLDVNGRDVERGADVVETEPDIIGGKAIREVEIESEQIADRVVVLLPVQPPDHDRCRADLLATLGGQEVVFDPGDDPVQLFERWLGLVGRRHDAALQGIAHAEPGPAVLDGRRLILESIEGDSRLGVFFHVAVSAILLEQRQDLPLKRVGAFRLLGVRAATSR